MVQLLLRREQVAGVLAERIQAGAALAAKEELAEKTSGYRDWISLFDDWRGHTLAELRAVYGGIEVPIEFEVETGTAQHSSSYTDFPYRRDALHRGLKKLGDLVERLELAVEPSELQPAARTPNRGAREAGTTNRNVFLVHGREASGFREQAARYLRELGLNAIILAEQANEGRTLIEKFEDKALEAGYAVVLLTPEDTAYGPGEEPPSRPNRARQNVILEVGYFMASLERGGVAALVQEGVEVPSDMLGIAYIPLDEGGVWKSLLGRELAAAGFDIDLSELSG